MYTASMVSDDFASCKNSHNLGCPSLLLSICTHVSIFYYSVVG